MSALVQAIAVPTLLALSITYLLFVAWASHRRREAAEAERLNTPAQAEPAAPPDAQPDRAPQAEP